MVRIQKSPSFRPSVAHLVVCALGHSDCRTGLDNRLVRILRRSTEIWRAELLASGNEQRRWLYDCLRCNTDRLPPVVIRSVWTHLRSRRRSVAYAFENWDFPEAARLDAKMVSTCFFCLRCFLDNDMLHLDLYRLSKSR